MDYDRFVEFKLGHLYNIDSCRKTEKLYDEVNAILKEYLKQKNIKKGSDKEQKFKQLLELDIESIDMNNFLSALFNIAALTGVVIGFFIDAFDGAIIDAFDGFIIKVIYSIIMTIMALYIFKKIKESNNIYPYKKKVLCICLKILG